MDPENWTDKLGEIGQDGEMKRKHYTKEKKAMIVLELLREEKTASRITSEYINEGYRLL